MLNPKRITQKRENKKEKTKLFRRINLQFKTVNGSFGGHQEVFLLMSTSASETRLFALCRLMSYWHYELTKPLFLTESWGDGDCVDKQTITIIGRLGSLFRFRPTYLFVKTHTLLFLLNRDQFSMGANKKNSNSNKKNAGPQGHHSTRCCSNQSNMLNSTKESWRT